MVYSHCFLRCFSLLNTHIFQNYCHWGAGLCLATEWCSGLTGPRPSGQIGSCPLHRPPCLQWHSSPACWGCCQCSQTHCPGHGKEALALLRQLTGPTKLRKAVSKWWSGPEKKINGTWTELSKDSRVAHPPTGEAEQGGDRPAHAGGRWAERPRTRWMFMLVVQSSALTFLLVFSWKENTNSRKTLKEYRCSESLLQSYRISTSHRKQ